MVRTHSSSVVAGRYTEGVNCEVQKGGEGDVQRSSMPPPVDQNITVHELWKNVQKLTRQNDEMKKNMQAMQTTQMHGDQGQNFPDPMENHSEQHKRAKGDRGEESKGKEGSKYKEVRARSRAEPSRAKKKRLAEEEPESRDEFHEQHQRIDVL